MRALIIVWSLVVGFTAQGVVMLKGEKITLQGPLLKVEDVFSGQFHTLKDTTIVTMQPGEQVTLKPHNLKAIAEKWNLDWVPGAVPQQVVVFRETFEPQAQEILDKLSSTFKSYLGAAYQPSGYEIELVSFKKSLKLPSEDRDRWSIQIQSYSPASGTLQAALLAGDFQESVSARVHPLQEIPVLTEIKQLGEPIRAQDLTLIKVRQSLVDARTVIAAEDLIGNTPKGKSLLPSTLIKTDQISLPQLVKKGNLVTITYASPVMQITTKGKALESGGRRDMIRVMNTSSKKIIDAEITGADTVTVAADSAS